jgi:hypothetical protein
MDSVRMSYNGHAERKEETFIKSFDRKLSRKETTRKTQASMGE